jgi:transcriptional regulator with XRE-family HTH domain
MRDEPVSNLLAGTVREARSRRGWTQAQLADAAAVSVPTIQRCENGKGITRPDVCRRLFPALGLDPRRLPVLLGYITDAEMESPARHLSPLAEEAVGLLEQAPHAAAREWVEFLRWRVGES